MTTKPVPTPGPDHARLVVALKELRRLTRDDPHAQAAAAWADAHAQNLILGKPLDEFTEELTYPEGQAIREFLQRWRDDKTNGPGLRAWCADQFAALTAEGARRGIEQRRRRASLSRLFTATGLRHQ